MAKTKLQVSKPATTLQVRKTILQKSDDVLNLNPELTEVWSVFANTYEKTSNSKRVSKLSPGIYDLKYKILPNGSIVFYLLRRGEKFEFNYKIYGNESELIKTIVKTYHNTSGNLGMVFNGLKGTGKTVTAKQICNQFDLPTIVVGTSSSGAQDFINSITQDVVVFYDEFEKIFRPEGNGIPNREGEKLLSIMDGSNNSDYRRVFVLTTNDLSINENLIQRPGRIRYIKKFDNISLEIIKEIIDDCLVHKQHRESLIEFISDLEIITIDILKSLIQEINIHNKSPEKFEHIFNIRRSKPKFKISLLTNTGEEFMVAEYCDTNIQAINVNTISLNSPFILSCSYPNFSVNLYKQIEKGIYEGNAYVGNFNSAYFRDNFITTLEQIYIKNNILKDDTDKTESVASLFRNGNNIKIIVKIDKMPSRFRPYDRRGEY